MEADGLFDEAKKIHCMAYTVEGLGVRSTTDLKTMAKLLSEAKVLIGHHIICYDIPVLEDILGIKIKAKVVDTLPLSWYMFPKRVMHGLDSFGKDYGIPKPKVDDWENQPIEVYLKRCEEDVKINQALWKDLRGRLVELYEGDMLKIDRFIDYMSFKMDCLREQEFNGIKLDVNRAESCLEELLSQQESKTAELIAIMPPIVKYKVQTKPNKPFKKDGTLSVAGVKWNILLKDFGKPEDYEGDINVPLPPEEPNPNSHEQVKNWLYSLGWEPETFKYDRDSDGNEKIIPQLRKDDGGNKVLCDSVLRLAEENPTVKVLEGLSIIQHRVSIFKGYVEEHKAGWLVASAGGLTNTLRFKHRKPLTNLPKVSKAWGEDIRGCLIAPKGYVLCGSDMVSLEDTTKRHYMYPHDPVYVDEMSQEGFDPHLDLAKHGGEVTQDEIDSYLSGEEGCKNLKPIRHDYKQANYACVYGVKKKTLSRQLKSTQSKADKLIKAYWKRNWAVEAVTREQKIKTINGQMWLLNPVSGFWYSLRYEKDIFSTLNQGTGVFCFDSWVMEFRKVKPQLSAQFHDEIVTCLKLGEEENYEKLLKNSIQKVNDKLNLNIKLDIDVQFGDNYAEIH